MKARTKRWLSWSGYPAAYLVMLIGFARCTFPYDTMRDRIVSEFNSREQTSGMRLSIADLSGYWLSGVEAEGVKLSKVDAPRTQSVSDQSESRDAAQPQVTTIDSMHASISLLRLIFGTTQVNFGLEAQGGEMSGDVESSADEQALEATLDRVALTSVPMLPDIIGLPVKGTIAGHVDLLLPERKTSKAEGKLNLTIDGVSAGDGKAKILNTIALPTLNVGKVTLAATVTGGRLKIDTMSAKGSDLDLEIQGNVRLRDPVVTSIMDLSLRFKFSDGYKNKNDVTRGLFGAPGSSVPGAFDFNDKVRRAKRDDGYYGWRIIGTLQHPLFEPSPGAAGARSSVRSSNSRSKVRAGSR